MHGPVGQLWVRRDKDAWKFDEATGAFVRLKPPWTDEAYDARYLGGDGYWIDFMRGIHVGARLIPTQSDRYPGKDPRSFSVDATGALWVADFDSGFYRLENDRFVKVPGVDEKGSGVAVDVEHKRRWLLHYTQGLVLQREGQPDERVELRGLEYMRDLLLDPATGDVWVAGWTELARVSSRGATWEQERFRVR